MSKVEQIALLLYKELEGKLSESESIELQKWKTEDPEHETFFEEIGNESKLARIIKLHYPGNKEKVRVNILKKLEDQLSFKVFPLYRRNFFRIAVAACIAALIIVGGYFMFFNNKQGDEKVITKGTDVEAPKSDKAVIQLADGRIIAVDSLSSYTQGNVTVRRMADGRLVYSGLGTEVQFNTLTNPKGSKVIDITLADGSHIWLNAGSSITYPTAFAGNERKVTVEGEAYFEVTKDPSKIFSVVTRGITTEVTGTHFNVNNYEDEAAIRITLLEGSVNVFTNIVPGAMKTALKPGEQAEAKEVIKVNKNVNLEEVMAWKNGLFIFTRADMRSIMREVARWYDLDVEYKSEITDHFRIKLSRKENVSMVFKKLQETGAVKFEVQGKKLIVSK